MSASANGAGRRVLVVGGNMAGLAAAIAFRKVGLRATVFERMPAQPPVGGGLHIWTNGSKALEWLGVLDPVRAAGEGMERLLFMRHDGKVVVNAPLGELEREYGNGAFFVPRVDVPRALLAAAEGCDVRWGTEVTGFEQRDGGVSVRLADGSDQHGAVLVGADGINSSVRRGLLGAVQPVYAGYQDWGAVFEYTGSKFPLGEFWTIYGPGSRAGLAHVGAGRVYWAASVPGPADQTEPPAVDEFLRVFEGWVEPLEEIVAATPAGTIAGAPIRELKPMKRWSNGRGVLIGDAAHAMQPGAGRGTSEALEDAVTLAQTLAGLGDLDDASRLEAALRDWEQRRKKSVDLAAKRSRTIGKVGKYASPVMTRYRDTYFRMIAPLLISQMRKDFRAPLAV